MARPRHDIHRQRLHGPWIRMDRPRSRKTRHSPPRSTHRIKPPHPCLWRRGTALVGTGRRPLRPLLPSRRQTGVRELENPCPPRYRTLPHRLPNASISFIPTSGRTHKPRRHHIPPHALQRDRMEKQILHRNPPRPERAGKSQRRRLHHHQLADQSR